MDVVKNVVENGRVTVGVAVHETLPFFAALVGDEPLGAIENGRGTAITEIELDHVRPVALDKVVDQFRPRAAPAIDGLIVIGDDGNAGPHGSQEFEKFVLGGVDVLVLIHQDMFERAVVVRSHFVVLADERHSIANEIIEIQGFSLGEPVLIQARHFHQGGVSLRIIFSGILQCVFATADVVDDAVDRVDFATETGLCDDSLDGLPLFVLVDNGEVGIQAEMLAKASQDAHRRGMECVHPDMARLFPQDRK